MDALVRLLRQAGAPSEASTSRNGAFSYHAETHAAGAGVGIGMAVGASGRWRLLGSLLTLAVYGHRGETRLGTALLEDIRQERHYFLGGLALGLVAGVALRIAA